MSSSYTVNSILKIHWGDNGIWATPSNIVPKQTSLGLTVPVNGAPLFYVSDNDAVRRALGATSPCYLYAQALLTLHHVHLPDVAALSGLQQSTNKHIKQYITELRYKCHYEAEKNKQMQPYWFSYNCDMRTNRLLANYGSRIMCKFQTSGVLFLYVMFEPHPLVYIPFALVDLEGFM